MKVTEKRHIGELTNAGDFCFVQECKFKPENLERLTKLSDEQLAEVKLTRKDLIPTTFVIMACPVCAGLFVCRHKIESKEPLTLSPSVVGPEHTWKVEEQVLAPCLHHFFVNNGEVIGV